MLRTIGLATILAGTLDIIFAIAVTLFYGRDPTGMLRYVASGPYPPAAEMGFAGSALGVLVHYALMAIMAGAYAWFARSRTFLADMPVRAGIAYGVLTYLIMNLIVVPLRFGAPVSPRPTSIATQLFAHVVLVGIPIAVIAARDLRARAVTK
jgi:uncharacterized membrane protein YagU involved in acid resistance